MKTIITLLSIVLIIYSCEKGKAEVTVRGILFDSSFALPLDNAEVKIYQLESGLSDKLIGESTTNLNGEYSFLFARDQTESYRITSSKENYYNINESILFSDITIENDNIYNFSTSAKSWVSLKFVNSLGSPSDVLNYLKQEGKSGCDNCCPDGPQLLNGIVDTNIIYSNDGNSNFSYQYFVVGTSDQGLKSTITSAFDTTIISLIY